MEFAIPQHLSAEGRQLYEQLRGVNNKKNNKKDLVEKHADKNV